MAQAKRNGARASPVKTPVSPVGISVNTVPTGMMPGRNGGLLKRGGNPTGAGGRPPDDWKAKCASLADRGAKAVAAAQVIENPDHPVFLGAWKFAAEQAHGKAQASVDLTTGGRPFLIVPDIE